MKLKHLIIENFKGIKYLEIIFINLITIISGQNATGKTTVLDAICWLLFGKDSHGNSKFEIRELDENGEKVHYTDISVTAVIEVDGDKRTIQRKQVENWVKKRGQEERELSGNKDNYFINGFPKSAKEYTEFISSIVDEDMFRILSNPQVFPNMKWQDQRKLLLSLINIDPEKIGKDIQYFDLIKDDLKQESPDAVKKKYTKSKNELAKSQEQIPIEINTLSGQIKEIDQSIIDSELSLKDSLAEIHEEITKLSGTNNEELTQRIRECQIRQNIIVTTANDERNSKIREAKNAYDEANHAYQTAQFAYSSAQSKHNRMKNDIEYKQAELENLRKQYASESKSTFPESKSICPTCGQQLQPEKIDAMRSKWESDKEARLSDLKARGSALNKSCANLVAEFNAETENLNACKARAEETEKELDRLSLELDKVKNAPASTGTDILEYQDLAKEIEKLKSQFVDTEEAERRIAELKDKEEEINTHLTNVAYEYSKKRMNEEVSQKIAEKTAELKAVAQRVAVCEQHLFALENYVRKVSDEINKHFDGLHFKLFQNQINGGVAECCEITYGGVPYSVLNSGHRIIVGVNIIKTFSKLFGVSVPLFIDNAESLSEGNVPEIDGQMILLKVSSDKTLTVE